MKYYVLDDVGGGSRAFTSLAAAKKYVASLGYGEGGGGGAHIFSVTSRGRWTRMTPKPPKTTKIEHPKKARSGAAYDEGEGMKTYDSDADADGADEANRRYGERARARKGVRISEAADGTRFVRRGKTTKIEHPKKARSGAAYCSVCKGPHRKHKRRGVPA